MALLDKALYEKAGHVTVPSVFSAAEMDAVIEDIGRWGEEFLRAPMGSARYIDGGVKAGRAGASRQSPFSRESIGGSRADPRCVLVGA